MKDLDVLLGSVVRGLCGVLPSHSRLNMFLGFWAFRFGLILVVLALSLNSVMAIRGSRLLFGDEALRSPLAAT